MGGFVNTAGSVATTSYAAGAAAGATGAGALTAGFAAMGPLGWGLLAGGALLSGLGASSKTRSAKERMGYISEQQAGITSALGRVGEIAEQKTGLAQDVYGEQIGEASYGAGQSLYDITQSGASMSQKVGFATSGELDTRIERGRGDVYEKFGFQKQSLQNVLGEKLMGIEEQRGAEEGRLLSEQSRLSYEMKQARRQSKGWLQSFLGG
jgi:hypothetical protein